MKVIINDIILGFDKSKEKYVVYFDLTIEGTELIYCSFFLDDKGEVIIITPHNTWISEKVEKMIIDELTPWYFKKVINELHTLVDDDYLSKEDNHLFTLMLNDVSRVMKLKKEV